MSNKIRIVPLMLAVALAGCQQAGQDAQSGSATPSTGAVEGAKTPTTTVELSDAQLCEKLTAQEVTAVLGSERTAGAYTLGGCRYENPNAPAVRLFNSPHATGAEHLDLIKGLKGVCKDGPEAALLCAVAFDLQNDEISSVWFTQDGASLEIEFDGGVAESEALALLAAARQ